MTSLSNIYEIQIKEHYVVLTSQNFYRINEAIIQTQKLEAGSATYEQS